MTLRERLHAIDSWAEGGPPVNDSTDDVCREALDQLDEMADGIKKSQVQLILYMTSAAARNHGTAVRNIQAVCNNNEKLLARYEGRDG